MSTCLNEIIEMYNSELNRVDEDFDWGEETFKILKKYGVINPWIEKQH